MIDEDLIAGNLLAQQALAFLTESEVLLAQKQRLIERVLASDPDQDDEQALKEIQSARRQIRFMESLHEQGQEWKKENSNEPR